MPFTIPNVSSATYAAQAGLDSGDLTVLGAGAALTGVVSGCAVTAQTTPDATVAVAAGVARVAGRRVAVAGGNVTLTAADATNPRHDLITADTAGALAAVAGSPAAITTTSEPVFPAIPAGRVVVAAVYRPAATTVINTGQITDKRVTITDPGVENVTWYGATGDGATDDTTAIQAVIDMLAGLGGGAVFFPPGTFLHHGLTLKTGVWLRGAGMYSTVLRLKAASNTPSITVFASPDAIQANAFWVGVLDMAIDGNRFNQADNNASHGIYSVTNPLYTKATNDIDQDVHHVFQNVYVHDTAGTGVWASGRGESRCLNVQVNFAQQYGFYVGMDSFLSACTAGQTGNHGFIASNAGSIRMTTCKAFYAGRLINGGTYTGAGFLASASGFYFVNAGTFGVTAVGCEAQDCGGRGYFLENCNRVTLQGCVADSNSTSGAGSYSAFELWATDYSSIDGVAYDRFTNGATTYQTTALSIGGGSDHNVIALTHSGFNGATVSAPVAAASSVTATNTVNINGHVAGVQSPTFAASFTPDIYSGESVLMTLTGNITVANPAVTALPGHRLTFIFVQDATGGRTVTWGSAYKVNWTPTTTANRRNMISFMYDGAAWQQVASTINTP